MAAAASTAATAATRITMEALEISAIVGVSLVLLAGTGRGGDRRRSKRRAAPGAPPSLSLWGAIRTRRRERARRRSACRSGGAGGVVPPFIVQPYIRVVERRARMRRGAGGRPRSSRARIPARYRYLPDGGFTWGWPGSKSSAGTDQASLTHRLCLASSGCDLYQSQVYFS